MMVAGNNYIVPLDAKAAVRLYPHAEAIKGGCVAAHGVSQGGLAVTLRNGFPAVSGPK